MRRCIKTGDGLLVCQKMIWEAAPVFELGCGGTVPCVRKENRQRERAIQYESFCYGRQWATGPRRDE